MLQNTFQHIPGISARTEMALWSAGIHTWSSFSENGNGILPAAKARRVTEHLCISKEHLCRCDPRFFADTLPSREHWRLFPAFRHKTAYLDIETTGLSKGFDTITTIALYDGRKILHYVQGENLDAFMREIRDYKMIVTYNGKCFDVPFIEQALGITMPQAHIDLRYILHSLGFRGGLKGCERQMGLSRGELEGVNGYLAVLLWREYQKTGEQDALETLLAYNIEDAINLETLMVMAYNLKLETTPFAKDYNLPLPERPDVPFAARHSIVRRLVRHC